MKKNFHVNSLETETGMYGIFSHLKGKYFMQIASLIYLFYYK